MKLSCEVYFLCCSRSSLIYTRTKMVQEQTVFLNRFSSTFVLPAFVNKSKYLSHCVTLSSVCSNIFSYSLMLPMFWVANFSCTRCTKYQEPCDGLLCLNKRLFVIYGRTDCINISTRRLILGQSMNVQGCPKNKPLPNNNHALPAN